MILVSSFLVSLLFLICDRNNQNVNSELRLDLTNSQEIDLGVLSSLYREYKFAVDEEDFRPPYRRIFHQNKAYEIHVKKLKNVNGYKRHNLEIKKSLLRNGATKLLYIINPVEAETPNAYLSINEFKDVLLREAKKNKELPTKETKRQSNKVNKNTNKRSKYIFITTKHESTKITTIRNNSKKRKTRKKHLHTKASTLKMQSNSSANTATNKSTTEKKYTKSVKQNIGANNNILSEKVDAEKDLKTNISKILSTRVEEKTETNKAMKQSASKLIQTESTVTTMTPEEIISKTHSRNKTTKHKHTTDQITKDHDVPETKSTTKISDTTEMEANVESEDNGVTELEKNTETVDVDLTDNPIEGTSDEETVMTESSEEIETTPVITSTVPTRHTYGVNT